MLLTASSWQASCVYEIHNEIGTASATMVTENLGITNFHALYGETGIYLGNKTIPIEVIYADEFEDIVLFSTNGRLNYSDISYNYRDGDICEVYSFPMGKYNKGYATIIDTGREIDGKVQILIETEAVKAGSSDDALILNGSVIGIIVSMAGENLVFAIPVENIYRRVL